jgi:hypothetical protein
MYIHLYLRAVQVAVSRKQNCHGHAGFTIVCSGVAHAAYLHWSNVPFGIVDNPTPPAADNGFSKQAHFTTRVSIAHERSRNVGGRKVEAAVRLDAAAATCERSAGDRTARTSSVMDDDLDLACDAKAA